MIDIDAIAQVIVKARPDVVALQELDVHTLRSGKDVDEAALLAAYRNANPNFRAYIARQVKDAVALMKSTGR